MRVCGPPKQVEVSSQRAETSQDRSSGKDKSGRTPHSARICPVRQVGAGSGPAAINTEGQSLHKPPVVPFAIQWTSRIVPTCQLRPSLDTFTNPIKHDGTQTDGIRTECPSATRRDSVRHGRPLGQPVQPTAQVSSDSGVVVRNSAGDAGRTR